MSDLFETAQIFEASAKLRDASAWLRQLASQPTSNATDVSHWAGEFLERLGAIDNNRQTAAGAHLAVQATSARPTYYASLFKIRQRLADAGLNTPDSVNTFLLSVQRTLRAGRGKAEMAPDAILLAADFLFDLSNGLLATLDHNGLPTSYPFIVPELAYHGNAS